MSYTESNRKSLLLYLDNIIVVAKDFGTRLQMQKGVTKALLKLKLPKCELLKSVVKHTIRMVSERGGTTNPEKVPAVRVWPLLAELKELQTFLRHTE